MKTIVAKFGGTSLADANQFRKVRDIILADPARRFVVASAPGKRFAGDIKVTDLLLICYQKAVVDQPYDEEWKAIHDRFAEIVADLGVEFPLEQELAKIRRYLTQYPQREYMASRGEYLNSQILAAYLGFTFVDPEWCVCFSDDGTFDSEMTQRTLGAALKPLQKAVIAGFYGADFRGNIHTFSRGGSDITGSIVARAIGAELYENWTDVSGLLTADPRIVDAPRPVDYLTYRELRTLSYMGASVLHTDAVHPASRQGIPINIRNTNRPEDAGTMIVRKLPSGCKRALISGVAGRTDMSVIQVEKMMVSDEAGFSAILLDILKRRRIPFEHCLTGIDTVSLVIQTELFLPVKDAIIEDIKTELKPDTLFVKEGLSMIAVVGEGKRDTGHAVVDILKAVADAGIEILTINRGAGSLNLIIGVEENKYKEAIRAIYAAIEG